MPHGRGGCVRRPALAAMTVPEGVDFGSVDGQPVRLVFLIATPPRVTDVEFEYEHGFAVYEVEVREGYFWEHKFVIDASSAGR